jgi:hypothetical protein
MNHNKQIYAVTKFNIFYVRIFFWIFLNFEIKSLSEKNAPPHVTPPQGLCAGAQAGCPRPRR